MKVYLSHVDFKLPVESPVRIALQLIEIISQMLSRDMGGNTVTVTEVKDTDQDKQGGKYREGSLHFQLWSLIIFMRQAKGIKREKNQVLKGMGIRKELSQ